jgi:hypothetical protein
MMPRGPKGEKRPTDAIATLTTFLTSATGEIVTCYDKAGTNDLTQATDANRPAITASALGTSYGMTFAAASSTVLLSTNTMGTNAQPSPGGNCQISKSGAGSSPFSRLFEVALTHPDDSDGAFHLLSDRWPFHSGIKQRLQLFVFHARPRSAGWAWTCDFPFAFSRPARPRTHQGPCMPCTRYAPI